MRSAAVVIAGAGAIGASVAHHLAARGQRDVLVIDRASSAGEGSTARATGGFRVQFSTEVNIRLSLLSRKNLLAFEEETGVDPGFRQHGYLFIASNGRALAALCEANEVQQRCGVSEARLIDPSEIRALNPAVEDESIIGGAFCAADGFIRPLAVVRGYVESARRAGVRFEYGTEIVEITGAGNRAEIVRTTRGDISAGMIINAAGAWAREVADVPVVPLRRCVLPTAPTSILPESMPMTIWLDDGYHLRVRDGRVLLLWPDTTVSGFDTTVPGEWIDEVERKTRKRVPSLRHVAMDRQAAWAGLYEMSPDRHAILGPAPGRGNVFLANGSSGHGVMHAPAIGQVVAEMVLGEATSIDVTALRPSRFVEGKSIVSSELL